jgi:MerR family mercuric resistance operon transcriptional regulator
MAALTIGRLAKAGGVGVETVRYYQRRGLLALPDRAGGYGEGTVRRYSDEDVRRLKFIRTAQAAGFTLEQISELLSLDASDDRPRVRALAAERIEALDARIAQLQAARDALSRLATSCASGSAGPCPILIAFES